MRITCTNNLPKVGKRMAQIVEAVRALSDSQGCHGVFVSDVIRKAYPNRTRCSGYCDSANCRNASTVEARTTVIDCTLPIHCV